jgi:hypothetical protein
MSPDSLNRPGGSMKNDKKQDKKSTLRPWLVDVVVDNLR